MITPVLARLRANSDFKFSVEDGLSLREYLQRHPDSYDEILKYTREGRLEWGATYKQPYESMYYGEVTDPADLSWQEMAEKNIARMRF